MASKTLLERAPTEGPESAWGPLGLEFWSRQRGCPGSGQAESSPTVSKRAPLSVGGMAPSVLVLSSESQKPVSVSGFDEHVLQDLDALLKNSAHLDGVCMINILSPVYSAFEQEAGSTKYSLSRLEYCSCF